MVTTTINSTGSTTTTSGGDTGGSSSTVSSTNATSADGASGTSSTDNGSGGSAATTESSSTSSTTTGGTVITGELPWTDAFEDYPPNAPADPNWTPMESGGDWRILSDGTTQFYAPQSEASNRNMTYAGDPEWTNVRIEVDVRLGSGGDSGTRIYLAVRASVAGSKLDYYHAYLRGDGRVRLGKYVGGSTDETFSDSVDTGVELDATTWHTFALTVVGDTLTAELDGDEIASAATTDLTAGFIALGVDGGTAEFDNVHVTEP